MYLPRDGIWININFADNMFKFNFLYENCCIFIQILLKFIPMGLMKNKQELVR